MTTLALRSPRSRWLAVSALYVGLTLLYAHPMLPVIGSALPNDTGDPGLNAWILWWNAHAIPLTEHWWNGPIFYPAHGAMALSETFLNLVPLSTPLQWAGASAVLTYNLLYLLSFPAAAIAAHALGHRLTGRHDAGLMAGLAFGFSPYRAAQMPHLQTLWSCWMPLGLWALHRYVGERRPRDLVLLGLCWLMNGLATGYFLFYFAVLAGLWILWFVRRWRDLFAIGGTLAIASLPFIPLLAGYQRFQTAFGLSRSTEEIQQFSADLTALWATTDAIVSHRWTTDPRPEGELYPGVVVAVLTIAGAIVAWRRTRRPADQRAAPAGWYSAQIWLLAWTALLAVVTYVSWVKGGWSVHVLGVLISVRRASRTTFLTLCVLALALAWNRRIVEAWRRRSPILFYTVAALVMLFCALGPIAHVNGVAFLDQTQTPYAWLMQLPGGHAFRVPARFATLFVLCLSTCGALALNVLTPRGSRAPMVAVLAAAIAIDGWVPQMHMAPVPPPINFAGLDHGMVMLELPMVDGYSDTGAMLRATQNGHVLVNGFSGYSPPHYDLLQDAIRRFDPSILVALQHQGPLLVFVHQGEYHDKYVEYVQQVPNVHQVQATAAGTLFQLPGVAAAHDPDQTQRIAAITMNGDATGTAAMIDGRLETRAHTPAPQTPGDQIVITFDRPIAVSAVRFDLGEFGEDYPRKLRIDAAMPGVVPWFVWEGGTRGAMTVGVLDDRRRHAVTLDLPASAPARQLLLTITEGDPTFWWSVAELKVFGR